MTEAWKMAKSAFLRQGEERFFSFNREKEG